MAFQTGFKLDGEEARLACKGSSLPSELPLRPRYLQEQLVSSAEAPSTRLFVSMKELKTLN